MRTTDERITAVQRRSMRLRRRRSNHALIALICILALPLVDLAGRHAVSTLSTTPQSGSGLFGAASLFGPSVGGYVLVAVIAAVIAVAITVLIVTRRRTRRETPLDEDNNETVDREEP